MDFKIEKYFPLLTSILWGTAYLSTKYALHDFSPMAIAAGRAVFAYLSLVIFYVLMGKKEYLKPKMKDIGAIAAVSLTGIIVFWWLMNVALEYTTATNSSLLITSNPLFVIIFSPLVLKEKVSRREWAGVVLGFIGSFLVISKGHIGGLFQSETLKGDAIALLAGFSFGIYVLLSRKFSGKIHPGSLTVNMLGFGALVLVPVSLLTGNSIAFWEGSVSSVAALIWMGVGCSAVASLLLLIALEKTRAAKASVYFFVVPVVAALTGYFMLNEKIGLWTGVGGLFILGGILFTVMRKPANRPAKAADATLGELTGSTGSELTKNSF